MKKTSPPRKPATSAALRALREEVGLTQPQLAERLDVAPGTVSDWETGVTNLRRDRLDRIAAALGIAPQLVDALVEAHLLLRQGLDDDLPIPVPSGVRAAAWSAAGVIARRSHDSLLDVAVAAQASRDRAAAVRAWSELSAIPPVHRELVLEQTPDFATWALVERLAAESLEEAHDRPDTALHLARLALRSAELATASESFRACLVAYAHAHLGNAFRVGNDFRAAEAEFALARALWPEGQSVARSPLSNARLLDLEASLRRDLRQFDQALLLIERALDLVPEGPTLGLLHLNQAFILEQLGDYSGALQALRSAARWITEEHHPRHYAGLLFNLAVLLVNLEQFDEAQGLLPEVRERFALTNDATLHLARVAWLQGRIHDALGHTELAITTIDDVRIAFTREGRFYDAALAALDLAVLYLRSGRTEETRSLSRQMAAVFHRLEVHREELASVRLFLSAAEREKATTELARRAATALRAAHCVPVPL